MNADKLEICPCGKSDACYVTEVNQDINNYFCYGCGFQSNSLMREGEETTFSESIIPNFSTIFL